MPDAVIQQTLREIDKAIDDVRAELGKTIASKHLASKRLTEQSSRHEELGGQIELALSQGRDDLALMALIGVAELVGLGSGLAMGEGLDVGRLLLLMLIVVFLFAFGITGLIGQRIVAAILSQPAPWFVAAPAIFGVALPITREFGRAVSKIMPRDETTAVTRDSLVGRVAVIVMGTASHANAAQARVRDAHGQVRYIMVEPDNVEDSFGQGSSVLLVRYAGAKYFAIHNTSVSLRDSKV